MNICKRKSQALEKHVGIEMFEMSKLTKSRIVAMRFEMIRIKKIYNDEKIITKQLRFSL